MDYSKIPSIFIAFQKALANLTNPVSLGRASPRRKRSFITLTNSRLLSEPSSANSNIPFIIVLLSMCNRDDRLTVFVEKCKDDVDQVVAEIHVSNSLRRVFQSFFVDASTGHVEESKCNVDVGDVLQEVEKLQVVRQ